MVDERISVLFWMETFFPSIGGAETLSFHLCRALKTLGYSPHVLTSTLGSEKLIKRETINEIPVLRLPFHRIIKENAVWEFPAVLKEITQFIDSVSPALIHLHTTGPSAMFYLTYRRITESQVPAVLTLHEFRQNLAKAHGLLPKTVNCVDHVIFVSQAMRRLVLNSFPDLKSKSSVIVNSLPEFAETPANIPLKKHLLCIGRLIPEKGFDVAIRAFANVYNKYPDARLTIAGDGTARESLATLVNDLNLDTPVHFTGFVSANEVTKLILDSDLVIVPSRKYEAFGLVALEALQRGRPVIASAVGGLTEIIEDNLSGLLVEPENIQMLSKSVLDLIEHPDKLITMGKNAREKFGGDKLWTRMVHDYTNIYKSFANERQRKSA